MVDVLCRGLSSRHTSTVHGKSETDFSLDSPISHSESLRSVPGPRPVGYLERDPNFCHLEGGGRLYFSGAGCGTRETTIGPSGTESSSRHDRHFIFGVTCVGLLQISVQSLPRPSHWQTVLIWDVRKIIGFTRPYISFLRSVLLFVLIHLGHPPSVVYRVSFSVFSNSFCFRINFFASKEGLNYPLYLGI